MINGRPMESPMDLNKKLMAKYNTTFLFISILLDQICIL